MNNQRRWSLSDEDVSVNDLGISLFSDGKTRNILDLNEGKTL